MRWRRASAPGAAACSWAPELERQIAFVPDMESPPVQLDPLEVLALVQPLILVIDRIGNISAAHGASDGFAGYRTVDLPGRSILDFVSETDREDLTRMLLSLTDNSVPHDPRHFPSSWSEPTANSSRPTCNPADSPSTAADGSSRSHLAGGALPRWTSST